MTDQLMCSDPVAGALQRLQTLVLDAPDVASFLSEAASLATAVLQPSAASGINVQEDGPRFAADLALATSRPTGTRGLGRTDSGR